MSERHHIEVATGVDNWARANHVLLERCFEHLLGSGRAPTLEQLQHDFSSAGEKVDVRALAYSMPPELGAVELDRLVLRVLALRYVPGASPILHTWFLSLKIACDRWLQSGDAAYLSRRDVLIASGSDPQRAMLTSYFLLSEGWPLGDGKGGLSDEWWRRITSAVLVVRDAQSIDDIFDRERKKERHDGVLARLGRFLFRHPTGASVTGGLVVAFLFWAISGVLPEISPDGQPDKGVGSAEHSKSRPSPSDATPLSAGDARRGQPQHSRPVPSNGSGGGAQRESFKGTASVKGSPAQTHETAEAEGNPANAQGVAAIGNGQSLGKERKARLNGLIAPPSICPGQYDSDRPPQAQKQTMLCMVHFARRKSGVPVLAGAALLNRAADRKSRDILRCDEFSHEACGREFTYWMEHFGYSTGCMGENLAWGSGSLGGVRSIFSAWLHSAGHRENILGDFADVGIGLKEGSLEGYAGAMVWTLEFGGPCQANP